MIRKYIGCNEDEIEHYYIQYYDHLKEYSVFDKKLCSSIDEALEYGNNIFSVVEYTLGSKDHMVVMREKEVQTVVCLRLLAHYKINI